jgi:YidC/Oxa1 family membrane protein insertase
MDERQKAMTKLFTWILTPLSLVITIWLPASVQFYFICTSALSMAQNLIMRQTWYRRLTNLPPLPSPAGPSGAASVPGQVTYQAPRAANEGNVSAALGQIRETFHKAKGLSGDHIAHNKEKKLNQDRKKLDEKRQAEEGEALQRRLQEKLRR